MTIELTSLQFVLGLVVTISAVVGITFGAVRAIAKPAIAESISVHLRECPVRDQVTAERKAREDSTARIERAIERMEGRLDDFLREQSRRGA